MGKQLEGDMEAFSEEVTRPEFHEETSHEQTWRKRMQREGTAALEDERVYAPGAGRAVERVPAVTWEPSQRQTRRAVFEDRQGFCTVCRG